MLLFTAYIKNYLPYIVFCTTILNVQFTIKEKYLPYYLLLINFYTLNHSFVNSTSTPHTSKTHSQKKVYRNSAIIAYVTLISMLPLTNFPDWYQFLTVSFPTKKRCDACISSLKKISRAFPQRTRFPPHKTHLISLGEKKK